MAKFNRPAILIVQMLLLHLIIPATQSDTTMSSSECKEQEQGKKMDYDEVKSMTPSGEKTFGLSKICYFVNNCSQNGDPLSGFSEILPDCPRLTCIFDCDAYIAKDVVYDETLESEEALADYWQQFQVQAMTDCLKTCPSPRDALQEYKGVLESWGCTNVKMEGEDEVMGEAYVTETFGVEETTEVRGASVVTDTARATETGGVTGKPQAVKGSGMNLMPVAVSVCLALALVFRNQL